MSDVSQHDANSGSAVGHHEQKPDSADDQGSVEKTEQTQLKAVVTEPKNGQKDDLVHANEEASLREEANLSHELSDESSTVPTQNSKPQKQLESDDKEDQDSADESVTESDDKDVSALDGTFQNLNIGAQQAQAALREPAAIQYIRLNDDSKMTSITFAYHVTNLPANIPDYYQSLRPSVADDETYDGVLTGQQDLKGVFFSVSLYLPTKNLPTKSTYPRHGAKGQEFKRVKVDVGLFDGRPLFLITSNGNSNTKAKQHVLASVALGSEAFNILRAKATQLDLAHNDLFTKRNNTWFAAAYPPHMVNVLYITDSNIAVCADMWDKVEHV